MKGGRNDDLDEAHQRPFDLHQNFLLFLRARDGNADAFRRFRPELANLSVTPVKG